MGDVVRSWAPWRGPDLGPLKAELLGGRKLAEVLHAAPRHQFLVARTGWSHPDVKPMLAAASSAANARAAEEAAAAEGALVVDTAEERQRRVEWIRYYVRSGDTAAALALGWDGQPFILVGRCPGLTESTHAFALASVAACIVSWTHRTAQSIRRRTALSPHVCRRALAGGRALGGPRDLVAR